MIPDQYQSTLETLPDICVLESIVRLSRSGQCQPTVELEKWIEETHGGKDWKQEVRLLSDSESGEDLWKSMQASHENGETLLRKIRQQIADLPAPDNNRTMGHLLLCLRDYILQKAKDASLVKERKDDDGMGFSIAWKEKVFHFQLSCSPFWQWQQTDMPLASIGPLMNNGLMDVAHFFLKPEARQNFAFFDPWSQRKINLVRDGLFSYVDWFFRDEFSIRFATPRSFSQMLMDYQILRYDIG